MAGTWRAVRIRGAVVVALAACLVAGACGSTRGDRGIKPGGAGAAAPATQPDGPAAYGQPPVDPGLNVATTPASDQGAPAANTSDRTQPLAPSGGTAAPPSGAAPATKKNAPLSAGQPPPRTAAPSHAVPTAAPGGTPEPGTPGPGTPASSGPATVPAGSKGDIVLGVIGTDSGLIGEIMAPYNQGIRAWVSSINARGGLNGHRLRVIVADDGGDPSKALSLARRMVEQDSVVAFYGEHGTNTSQAVLPFLEQRQIPWIGTCNCTTATAHSPMVFEVGPGADHGVAWSNFGPLLSFSDKRKVSLLYCRESPTCTKIVDRIKGWTGATGVKVVHEAQVTLTQPDYTAEVLAARNAGAEALILMMDASSPIRLVRSARRQNYNPAIVLPYTPHNQAFLDQNKDEMEGLMFGALSLHWDSPKLADYRAALGQFVPGAKPSSFSIAAWNAGKLLEVVAAAFPGQVTSADILKALYAVKGETLGGLTPPLTYLPGQGSDGMATCVIPVQVRKGRFVTADGENFKCAPGWQPRR